MSGPQIPNDSALVYLRGGRRAHLADSGNARDTECGAVRRTTMGNWRRGIGDSFLLGTGSQAEYDRAKSLPLCIRCFPNGPRRPEVSA